MLMSLNGVELLVQMISKYNNIITNNIQPVYFRPAGLDRPDGHKKGEKPAR